MVYVCICYKLTKGLFINVTDGSDFDLRILYDALSSFQFSQKTELNGRVGKKITMTNGEIVIEKW